MAGHSHNTFLLLIIFSILISFPLSSSAQPPGIAVYWGQNGGEGSLAEACATGLYRYVNIAFLTTFGSGRIPVLNLAGHCDPSPCTGISNDIRECQARGVQVLLSLGGARGNYSLSSADDAGQVANYLWNNFLGGNSSLRLLGDAILDGIDFDIESGSGSGQFWDDLARAISAFNSQRRVHLSAAPQCPIPDAQLNAAIQTGLFDYVWVQFYNNMQCDYSGGVDSLLRTWNQWINVTNVTETWVFLGLPASNSVAGYMPPNVLTSEVLPVIRSSARYGGVMVWDRYSDQSFSSNILSSVSGSVTTIFSLTICSRFLILLLYVVLNTI